MPNPAITRFKPGESTQVWRVGDFILTHNLAPWYTKQGFVSGMIVLGQWINLTLFRRDLDKDTRKYYSRVSHAAGVVGIDDIHRATHLVEALGHGVERSPLNKYTSVEYLYIATDLNDAQREDFRAYEEYMVGTKYGFLTIVSIVPGLLTGTKIALVNTRHVICSGLQAAALGIYRSRSNPSEVKPDDLCEYHGVQAP